MRLILGVLLVFSCVLLTGCWNRPDPVPQHTVTVLVDVNGYLFDGQAMVYDQVLAELQAVADKNRRSATGNARAYLKIITQPGADYNRVGELIDFCASIGLDKIETTGR
jgi:hypothetical protein